MTTSQNKFDEDNSQALNDLNGVKYDTYNNNISRSVINSNFLTNNITIREIRDLKLTIKLIKV